MAVTEIRISFDNGVDSHAEDSARLLMSYHPKEPASVTARGLQDSQSIMYRLDTQVDYYHFMLIHQLHTSHCEEHTSILNYLRFSLYKNMIFGVQICLLIVLLSPSSKRNVEKRGTLHS